MNAVIGLTQRALQTELSAQQRDYLGKVNAASLALLGVLNGILDFSKIEAVKLTVETLRFDLREVVTQLADLLELKAAERDLAMCYFIDPELPQQMLGAPLRLRQVLLNLADNAIKFRYIVERLGGTMRVQSEVGCGSSFAFQAEFGLPASNQGADAVADLAVAIEEACPAARGDSSRPPRFARILESGLRVVPTTQRHGHQMTAKSHR